MRAAASANDAGAPTGPRGATGETTTRWAVRQSRRGRHRAGIPYRADRALRRPGERDRERVEAGRYPPEHSRRLERPLARPAEPVPEHPEGRAIGRAGVFACEHAQTRIDPRDGSRVARSLGGSPLRAQFDDLVHRRRAEKRLRDLDRRLHGRDDAPARDLDHVRGGEGRITDAGEAVRRRPDDVRDLIEFRSQAPESARRRAKSHRIDGDGPSAADVEVIAHAPHHQG